MAKVRLKVTVDVAVAERARRFAARHHTSISKLVEDFLSRLPDASEQASELGPITRRLVGIAKDGPEDAEELYRPYLVEKYSR